VENLNHDNSFRLVTFFLQSMLINYERDIVRNWNLLRLKSFFLAVTKTNVLLPFTILFTNKMTAGRRKTQNPKTFLLKKVSHLKQL